MQPVNSIVANVAVGRGANGVSYDSGTGEVSVTNSLDNTTSVISDSSNSVVTTIPVGSGPGGIAYDSGNREILVMNYNGNTMSVISDSNNTVVATIGVGRAPYGVAYDSGKGEIFVTNSLDNTVSVISPTVVTGTTSGTTVATSQPSAGGLTLSEGVIAAVVAIIFLVLVVVAGMRLIWKKGRSKSISPSNSGSSTNRFCSNCGAPTSTGGGFCSKCGKVL